MTSIDLIATFLGILASVGVGILANWIYDFLRSKGKLPNNPTLKLMMIAMLVIISLSATVGLLNRYSTESEEVIESSIEPTASNCAISVSEVSVARSVMKVGERVELSIRISNPQGEVVLYSWEALYGTVSPGARSASAYSVYTAPDYSVDDFVTVVVTSPNCGQINRSKQLSVTLAEQETDVPGAPIVTDNMIPGQLFIQFGEYPVKPLLNGWVAPLSPECTDFADFYYTEQVDFAQKYSLSAGPKITGPSLPWTPAVVYFSIQSDFNNMVNITDIVVTQEYKPLEREFVGYQRQPICAGDVPGSIFGFSGTAQSLGLVELAPERERYQILDLDLAQPSLILESSGIMNFYLFLSGYVPGVYHITVIVQYQFMDSGVLVETSNPIEAIVLGTDHFDGWYTEDWETYHNDQFYLGKITSNHPYENLWRLSDFNGVRLRNLVSGIDGEYVILENTTDNQISLSNLWALYSCDGSKLTELTTVNWWNNPIILLPNDTVRFGTSDNTSSLIESYFTLPNSVETLGRCILLTYADVPVAQFPRR